MSRPPRLSVDEVRAIKRDPRSYRAIADTFNISIPYVGMLKRGIRRVEVQGRAVIDKRRTPQSRREINWTLIKGAR